MIHAYPVKTHRSWGLMTKLFDIKSAENPTPQEIAAFALRMVNERIQFRIDAMNEHCLDGVSISKSFAGEIVRACRRGSDLLENPEPAQAGLTAGGGSGSANVSEGVTGGGERAAGDAAGEIGGLLAEPKIVDPAARTLRCPGVGRDKDNISALQFYFSRPVTDDEMRFLHDVMKRAVACAP